MKTLNLNLSYSLDYAVRNYDLFYHLESGKLRMFIEHLNDPVFHIPIFASKLLYHTDTRFVDNIGLNIPFTYQGNVKSFSNGVSGLKFLTRMPQRPIHHSNDPLLRTGAGFNKVILKDKVYYGFPGFIMDENFDILLCTTLKLSHYSLEDFKILKEHRTPTKAELEYQKSCYNNLDFEPTKFGKDSNVKTGLKLENYYLIIHPKVLEDQDNLIHKQIIQKYLPLVSGLKVYPVAPIGDVDKEFYSIETLFQVPPFKLEYGKNITNVETLEDDINNFLKVEKDNLLYQIQM